MLEISPAKPPLFSVFKGFLEEQKRSRFNMVLLRLDIFEQVVYGKSVKNKR